MNKALTITLFLLILAVIGYFVYLEINERKSENKILTSDEVINRVYFKVFRRKPDKTALKYWREELERGISTDEIIRQLKDTDEYQQMQSVPG